MSCTCPETNWMDGKGHDAGCPLWKATMNEDNIDICLVCGTEIPPGPDFCSPECEVKMLRKMLHEKDKREAAWQALLVLVRQSLFYLPACHERDKVFDVLRSGPQPIPEVNP